MEMETPFDRWCRFTEEAWCSPDTTMSPAELRARWIKQNPTLTHATPDVEDIESMQRDAWNWVHSQPSKHVATLRLGRSRPGS
jgi:hypothetical protein